MSDKWPVDKSIVIRSGKGETNTLGLYISEVSGHDLLSPKQEAELFAELDRVWPERHDKIGRAKWSIPAVAERVVDEIVWHNYRLVLSIAFKFRGRGIDTADLIQEGNLGLLQAVRRFDVGKKTRFSTYATYWIRQGRGRAIANDRRTIRIPVHTHGRITLVSQAKAKWLAEFGRPPTRQELSVETGLPEKEIDLITRYSGPQGVESLDAPLKGGDDDEPPTLATFLASDEPGIEDETITADIRQIVTEAMGVLTPRECRILEERFGLREDDTEGKKLHEIAAKFGLTRERIRQVQQDALQRLAKDDRLKGLHYD